MWTVIACLIAANTAMLVVLTKVALDRESDRKVLAVLQAAQRKAAAEEWEEETTVYSVKGVPTLNRMPWRIRAGWALERARTRFLVWWRKLVNL